MYLELDNFANFGELWKHILVEDLEVLIELTFIVLHKTKMNFNDKWVVITVSNSKATQTRLLVSRPHPDEYRCGEEGHYLLFIISSVKNSLTRTHYAQVHKRHSDQPSWQTLAQRKETFTWQLT